MNEFMKEELELIESYFIKEDVVPDKPYIHLSLLRKIQTMIDNFCDHEWANSRRLDWLYYCVKCRKERCKRCAMELTKCHKFIKRGKNDLD